RPPHPRSRRAERNPHPGRAGRTPGVGGVHPGAVRREARSRGRPSPAGGRLPRTRRPAVSAFSEVRRAEVAGRAGHRCEYCHLPTRGQVATFPIDHVIPRGRGGATDLDNLALTCPHCNAHKWTAVEGPDPDTGETVRFFHPRQDTWTDHFE